MDLIKINRKNACKFIDQQRANIARLQELRNTRDNVVCSDLEIHEVNGLINYICTELIIKDISNQMLEI